MQVATAGSRHAGWLGGRKRQVTNRAAVKKKSKPHSCCGCGCGCGEEALQLLRQRLRRAGARGVKQPQRQGAAATRQVIIAEAL